MGDATAGPLRRTINASEPAHSILSVNLVNLASHNLLKRPYTKYHIALTGVELSTVRNDYFTSILQRGVELYPGAPLQDYHHPIGTRTDGYRTRILLHF